MRPEIALQPAARAAVPPTPARPGSLQRAAAAGSSSGPGAHHADRIRAVVGGRAPAEDALDLATSWDRCLSPHRIDPASNALAHVLTSTELRDHRGPLEQVIRVADDELDRLHSIVGQSRYVVLLCDANGVAVDCRVSAADADDFRAWGFYFGASGRRRWKEPTRSAPPSPSIARLPCIGGSTSARSTRA